MQMGLEPNHWAPDKVLGIRLGADGCKISEVTHIRAREAGRKKSLGSQNDHLNTCIAIPRNNSLTDTVPSRPAPSCRPTQQVRLRVALQRLRSTAEQRWWKGPLGPLQDEGFGIFGYH